MASIGEGAARGLESGFRLGQSFLDRQQMEEERRRQQEMQAMALAERQADRAFAQDQQQLQNARLARQDARQATMDERQQNIDVEQALSAEFAELQNEGRGLLEQFGGFENVPKNTGDSYALRVKDVRGRLTEQRAKRYAPLVEAERRNAGELWSKIQAGQVPLEQVDDDQLVSSLTALTRRDIDDLLPGKGGAPSKVQQAGQDFATAAQTGNEEMMLNAANVLFKPELMTGVGGPGRDGSEIVSKRIVQLIPHPQDPTQFTPLLEVKVRREDGKVGTYRAPVTENRTSDSDDNIRTISMQDGLERVGQLTTLAQALNQRGIVEKLNAGKTKAGDGPKNFLEAYYATGGKKPEAKKRDIGHFEDFGTYKIHYLPNGQEVRINKTQFAPQSSEPKDSQAIRDLESARRAGVINQDEYLKRRRELVLEGSGKKGGDDKPLNEGQAKANVFSTRMAESNAVLGEMEARGVIEPGRTARAAEATGVRILGLLGNYTQSDEEQQVSQAQRDFINATLRRESGAAIADSEFSNAAKQYFPQPGDKTDVLERKKRNRELAIETMRAEVPEKYRTPVPSLSGRSLTQEKAARANGLAGGGQSTAVARQPQEGDIARNPSTGERIQLRGGQWVPLK